MGPNPLLLYGVPHDPPDLFKRVHFGDTPRTCWQGGGWVSTEGLSCVFTFFSIGFIERPISHHILCLYYALFVEILFCSVRMLFVSQIILLFVTFSNLIEGSRSIPLLIIYKSNMKFLLNDKYIIFLVQELDRFYPFIRPHYFWPRKGDDSIQLKYVTCMAGWSDQTQLMWERDRYRSRSSSV